MKHIYAVFYSTLTGKKTEHQIGELAFEPTKIVSANEILKAREALEKQHQSATQINITGMLYLRSHEE